MERYRVFNYITEMRQQYQIEKLSALALFMYEYILSYFQQDPEDSFCQLHENGIEEIREHFVQVRDEYIRKNPRNGRTFNISNVRVSSTIMGRPGIVTRAFHVGSPTKKYLISIDEKDQKDSNRNYRKYNREEYTKPEKYKRCKSLIMSDSDFE